MENKQANTDMTHSPLTLPVSHQLGCRWWRTTWKRNSPGG